MDASDPHAYLDPPSTTSGSVELDPSPDTANRIALRDAEAVLDRAIEDERAALELRSRLRTEPLPTIGPDSQIADALSPGERIVALREAVVAERRSAEATDDARLVRLYVTTTRLILVGRATWSIPLGQIDELSVAGEQVLISLVDGSGVRLDGGSPRVLRVQIAAARADIRT